MTSISRALAQACVAAAPAALLTACQTYEPRPLDLPAHANAWRERDADHEAVATFVRRLDEAGDARAASFDPSDGLTLAEAELVALVFNPDLRVARLRAGVAEATAANAGLWDDPTFQIDVLRITESVSSPWVVTPGLAFTIPISGRLEVEKAQADASHRAELDRVAESEWIAVRDLRRQWAEWSAATLRLEETESLIAAMDSVVGSTARLAEAGEMPRTEASLFAIEQVSRRNEARRLRGQVLESEQILLTILGLSPGAPIRLVHGIPTPAPPPPDADDELTRRNLTLARLRTEYDVAEETLHREILKQYPDITLGPLYETDQGQSRVGFLGAIPLPILNANRQGIAEATAERELARAEFETEYERLQGSLAALAARIDAVRAQRDDMEQTLVPLVDRQLVDARRLLELGEGGGLVLLESLVRAQDTKLQLIEVRQDEAVAAVELDHLIGPEPATPPAETGSEVPE